MWSTLLHAVTITSNRLIFGIICLTKQHALKRPLCLLKIYWKSVGIFLDLSQHSFLFTLIAKYVIMTRSSKTHSSFHQFTVWCDADIISMHICITQHHIYIFSLQISISIFLVSNVSNVFTTSSKISSSGSQNDGLNCNLMTTGHSFYWSVSAFVSFAFICL